MSSAFAWITSAVPPLVNTECASPSASGMPGAVTVAFALPFSSTVKFGMSPAWAPSGFCMPCFLLSGLKWPPADLKSGPSHFAVWWTWMACSPGDRSWTASLIETPFAAAVSVAVPTSLPVPSASLTVTGLGLTLVSAPAEPRPSASSASTNATLVRCMRREYHDRATDRSSRRT